MLLWAGVIMARVGAWRCWGDGGQGKGGSQASLEWERLCGPCGEAGGRVRSKWVGFEVVARAGGR